MFKTFTICITLFFTVTAAATTVRLSPQIRSEPIENEIPPIAINIIKPFLNSSRVVPGEVLDRAPFIIAHVGEHVVAGTGDKIFAEGMREYRQSNLTDFAIVRKSQPYVDPKTNKILGYEALDVGTAHLVTAGNPSTLIIATSRMEILRGDKILPLCEDYSLAFHPKVPDSLIEGQIIGVMGGVTQISQFQVVVFDRGSRDEVKVGDMFAVFQQGNTINNPDNSSHQRYIKLPGQRAGEMMVFRTFDRVSYGLIMHATMPIHLMDIAKTPVA